MRRLCLAFVLLFAATYALAQISLPWPGPGAGGAAPPPPGNPFAIGSNSGSSTGGSTITMTTTAAVPAGNMIAVHFHLVTGTTGGVLSTSVTDTAGNTYHRQIAQLTATSNPGVIEIWTAFNATALPSGSTITINNATTLGRQMNAWAWSASGVTSTRPIDQTNIANTTSATPSISVTTTVPVQVLIGVLMGTYPGIPQTTFTEASGWTNLFRYQGSGGTPPDSNIAYKQQTSVTTQTYNPTTSQAPSSGAYIISTGYGNQAGPGTPAITLIGNLNQTSSNTHTITLTAAAPAGSTIIVVGNVSITGSLCGISSIADSASNTYASVAKVACASSSNQTDIWQATNVAALSVGQTITVTYTGNMLGSPASSVAYAITGLKTPFPVGSAANTIASAVQSPTITATMFKIPTMQIGILGAADTTAGLGFGTESTGFTSLNTFAQNTGSKSSNVHIGYRTGALDAGNWTYNPSWAAAPTGFGGAIIVGYGQ